MSCRHLLYFIVIVTVFTLTGCDDKKSTQPESQTVSSPVINMQTGDYYSPMLIQISCPTPNAIIRYTTNGSTPGSNSTLYTEPFTVESSTIISARAYKNGWNASAVVSADYNFISPPNPAMQLVLGGSFIMGNTQGTGHSSETPFHRVTVSSFYLDKYEVTQAQFREIMGYNQSYFPGDTLRPAEQVSWFDAIEFCNKRSMAEGFTPCYSYAGGSTDCDSWPEDWNSNNNNAITCNWESDGYRLPTEAEWEYAAKGGQENQGFVYAGSNSALSVSWYSENSEGKTHPIGLKLPNELNIYDLSGNVWEWCWDWSSNYTPNDQTNPLGPDNGSDKILRGGSWYYSSSFLRVNLRGMVSPVTRYLDIGFRCARKAS